MIKDNHKSEKFKDLLEKLQQGSWQLELLISGFAIFGLASSIDVLSHSYNQARSLNNFSLFVYFIARIFCYILIINLVIHVILRGLWIGAIGLRYVSGEINYSQLNYSKQFTTHLKKKVGSFDKYIARLENYCSILFATTFLTLFYFLGFISVFLVTFIIYYISLPFLTNETNEIIFGLIISLFLFTALIVFIDFVTQGLLKKNKWISRIYFPIYKVFGYITFAFLYRPIVYNFLDNKFGRRIAFILVPLYVLIIYIGTIDSAQSKFLSLQSLTSANYAETNNYLDELEKNEFVLRMAIESKVINKPYLNIFVTYDTYVEDYILSQNKELQEKEDMVSINSRLDRFSDSFDSLAVVRDSIYSKYLNTFNNAFSVKIDTISFQPEFIITSVNNQLGFQTMLPLKGFSEGKHLLKFGKTKPENNNQTSYDIIFWYYKD